MQVTLEPFHSGGQGKPANALMDTTAGDFDYKPVPTPSPMSSSGGIGTLVQSSSERSSSKKGTVSGSAGGGGEGDKDGGKYLEQFLASLGPLPEFVKEKVGKIKGLEKAILIKSAALKEASAYHVTMIQQKLAEKKKGGSGVSSGAGAGSGGDGDASGNNGNSSSAHDFGSSSNNNSNFNSGNNSGSSFQGSGNYGSGSGSGSGNFSSNSNSNVNPSNLPPLPIPSPLSQPLPYTLTPAVIHPLPTENLLNNLTYLLIGPVIHANTMMSPPIPPSNGAVSRQEMGIMPMNISPAALPPTGKKSLTASAVSAFAHPYASIPSPIELASVAVAPAPVDNPSLSNDKLSELRSKVIADYDLDQAEKWMREQQACLLEWQRRKSSLVGELSIEVDSLLKRAEAALKKQENKLRRGAFEVPPTPIDRRRTTMMQVVGTKPTNTTQPGASPTALSAVATSNDKEATRKRSYGLMVHELEARELQYAMQNELRVEIEKQSQQAIASHAANLAAGGSSASAGSPAADANEPVYCTCKKVSFGAMVACDSEDCEIEWFHFACVGQCSSTATQSRSREGSQIPSLTVMFADLLIVLPSSRSRHEAAW